MRRRRGWRGAVALAVVVVLAGAVAATALLPPAATTAPPPPASPPPHERGRVLLGAFTNPPGVKDEPAQKALIRRRTRDMGRPFDLQHWFYAWGKPFPSWREPWYHRQGSVPLISWGGTDSAAVAAGVHDAEIVARADAVAELGFPVSIRYFWEMDAAKNRHRARDPESYVAAWRRIARIFERRGARDVTWVWCPTALGFMKGEAQRWYPGDDVVDWVCADGYNWPPGWAHVPWRSFEEIFTDFHVFGLQRDKPMMIAEFGVQERQPGEKARWLEDIPRVLTSSLHGIDAIVYFDTHKGIDWRLDTSRESYEAFLRMAAHPVFRRGEPPEPAWASPSGGRRRDPSG